MARRASAHYRRQVVSLFFRTTRQITENMLSKEHAMHNILQNQCDSGLSVHHSNKIFQAKMIPNQCTQTHLIFKSGMYARLTEARLIAART